MGKAAVEDDAAALLRQGVLCQQGSGAVLSRSPFPAKRRLDADQPRQRNARAPSRRRGPALSRPQSLVRQGRRYSSGS